MNGGAGNDALDGGSGTDVLNGGEGNDVYTVGDSGDTIVDSSGIDTVQSYLWWVLQPGIENLTLIGSASYGVGNNTDNTIIGNAENNPLLRGEAGADTIFGGAGNDAIDGGIGNNAIVGGPGADIMLGSGINPYNSAQLPTGTPGSDLFVYYNLNEAGDSIYGFDTRPGDENRLFLYTLFQPLGITGNSIAALEASGHMQLAGTTNTAVRIDADGALGPQGYTNLLTLFDIAPASLSDADFFFQI